MFATLIDDDFVEENVDDMFDDADEEEGKRLGEKADS